MDPNTYTEFSAWLRSFCAPCLTTGDVPSARRRRPRTLRPHRYRLQDGALIATTALTLKGGSL